MKSKARHEAGRKSGSLGVTARPQPSDIQDGYAGGPPLGGFHSCGSCQGAVGRAGMPRGSENEPRPEGARQQKKRQSRAVTPAAKRSAPLGRYAKTVSAPERPVINDRWALLSRLRSVSLRRTSQCRLNRLRDTVQLQFHANGMSISGTETCGNVHGCPCCAAAICTKRAEEVTKAVTGWGIENCHMWSATVRHGMGDDLASVRRILAAAWRRFWGGRAGLRWREELGIKHSVRALETTYGSHGWHPHFHVLFFRDNGLPLTLSQQYELAERWAACVHAISPEHTPDLEHGLRVTPCHNAAYIAKLGLEVVGITKQGKRGNLSPWQIAQAAAAGDPGAVALWQSYIKAMRNARQLVWSRGAKKTLGIKERSDDELAPDELEEKRPWLEVPGKLWDRWAKNWDWLPLIKWLAETDPLRITKEWGIEWHPPP